MALEYRSVDEHAEKMNRSSVALTNRSGEQNNAEQLSQEFAGELDAASIEASLARAKTLIFDEVPVEELLDLEASQVRLKYVQHAYLITNLMRDESQSLLQPQKVWTIGRNRDAALPLPDPMLSRRHAVILHIKNEGFYLVDLNSMNGSFVNGVRVQHRHLLQDGDRVCLGNTAFTFLVSDQVRALPAIHPEIVARFSAAESRPLDFIDYLAPDESLFG
jgi:hypothetical protein